MVMPLGLFVDGWMMIVLVANRLEMEFCVWFGFVLIFSSVWLRRFFFPPVKLFHSIYSISYLLLSDYTIILFLLPVPSIFALTTRSSIQVSLSQPRRRAFYCSHVNLVHIYSWANIISTFVLEDIIAIKAHKPHEYLHLRSSIIFCTDDVVSNSKL